MGLHLLVLGFSKLHAAPFLANLAWPFFLKLNHIIAFRGHGRRRWERIIRLVHARLPANNNSNNDRSMMMPFANYDQSLQALSIVAF
nr:hypothetical protein [Tanacetum cinerariifolium]